MNTTIPSMSRAAQTRPRSELAPYLTQFDADAGRSKAPAWLQAIHRSGISHFAELGFPTMALEDWIFCNVTPIAKLPFKPFLQPSVHGLSPAEIAPFLFDGFEGPRLAFVNGHYSAELSSVGKIEGGIRVMSLAAAVAAGEPALEAHLSRYASADENGFSALNTAFFRDGAFIFVPAGRVLECPVHILNVTAGGDPGVTSHPRHLVIAQANSQVKVVESYVSTRSTAHFTNAVTELVAGEGARLEHCKFQEEHIEAFHVGTTQAHVGRGSHVTCHSISSGARIARHQLNMLMAEPGGDCIMNGLYLVGGKQLVDHHTIADHAKPNCGSHEFFHGILGGQSRGVFNGKIFVRKDAQKTDAKQTNRNLLVSDKAMVDTKPQLEILADDVKCTHGATVGQMNEEAIFYLRSRGIGQAGARQMLVHAFAGEIVNRISVEPVRRHLEKLLGERIELMVAPADAA
jgi:Fe-S cluster assembly protein SufD